jgi:hypothetical protein
MTSKFVFYSSSWKIREDRSQFLLSPALRVRSRVLHVSEEVPALPHVQGRVQEVSPKTDPGNLVNPFSPSLKESFFIFVPQNVGMGMASGKGIHHPKPNKPTYKAVPRYDERYSGRPAINLPNLHLG